MSLKGNLLSSLDPYNTAEYMGIIINNMVAVLKDNQSLALDGDLTVCLHMVSHYDECKLVDIHSTHLELNYGFMCHGLSHSHHNVVRCVPSKLPVLSQGKVCDHPLCVLRVTPDPQVHDSYAMFRSSGMIVDVKFSVRNEVIKMMRVCVLA